MTSGTGVTDSCHAFSETLPALASRRRRRDVGEVGDRFFGDVVRFECDGFLGRFDQRFSRKCRGSFDVLLRERSDNRLGSDSREGDGIDAVSKPHCSTDEVVRQLTEVAGERTAVRTVDDLRRLVLGRSLP